MDKLSRQQKDILFWIADQWAAKAPTIAEAWKERDQKVYQERVYGWVTWHYNAFRIDRWERKARPNLTPSQRAARSRSVRRLIERGLIEKNNLETVELRLTPVGEAIIKQLQTVNVCNNGTKR